ncbi:MAG: hypothetical protein HY678_03070 [Chloroflexi bacterium]|nr:hypothetical protein [Chloroflexota bacterium]
MRAFVVAGLLAAGLAWSGSQPVALAKCSPEGEAFTSRSYEQGGAFRNDDTIAAFFWVRDSGCRNGEHYVEPVSGLDATAHLYHSRDGPIVMSVPAVPGDSPGEYVARVAVPADGSWWWIRVLVDGEQIKNAGGNDLLLWGVKGGQASLSESQSQAPQRQSSIVAIAALASTAGVVTLLVAAAALLLRRRSSGAPLRIGWPTRSRRLRA